MTPRDTSSNHNQQHDVVYVPPQERKRTRRALLVVVLIFGLLFGGLVGGAAWLSAKLDDIRTLGDPFQGVTEVNNGEPRPSHPESDTSKPINFLMLGTDSRISAGDPSQWVKGAQRTDAFMILQIAGDRESVNVISIPRDSWVEIPGYGKQKINAAFSYGGPTLTIATVEQLTGIPIDHVAVVDFTSFSALTDVLGGVTMTTSTEGTQTYDGEAALAFVRERKNLPGGDFDRVRRQQLWMKSVADKVLTRETLSNPANLLSLYNTVSPYVAVDEAFSLSTILDLGMDFKAFQDADFNFLTAPNNGTATSADGQSIVVLDEANFGLLAQAFIEDRAEDFIKNNSDSLETLNSGEVR
ncbi:MAG: LCP family protein [Gleimia sp.]|jgi:LCP family protein required for cell wall assembly